MNPIGVGFVRFDFEFHDARGFVGMDGRDGFLYFRPVRFPGLHDGDDFLGVRYPTFPPVGALDGEVVHARDKPITQQSFSNLLRLFHVRMRGVDDDEFHNANFTHEY